MQSPRYDVPGLNEMPLIWVSRILKESHRSGLRVKGADSFLAVLETNRSKIRPGNEGRFDQTVDQAAGYLACA